MSGHAAIDTLAISGPGEKEVAVGWKQLEVKMKEVTVPLPQEGNAARTMVLRKFGVSLRDPDPFSRNFGMPIDLAFALLRDPSGDIRLKIPVKIDEKGTARVSMGAVIAIALKAALLGAVTAPLKMLGAAFGGSGEGEGEGLAIAPVGALPGAADLVADATARVDGLPDLEDSGFPARRRIGQALLARDKAATRKAEVPTLSAEDQALFDRYLASVEIPAARLDALAAARAGQVRDLLQARKVEPGRVVIGQCEAES